MLPPKRVILDMVFSGVKFNMLEAVKVDKKSTVCLKMSLSKGSVEFSWVTCTEVYSTSIIQSVFRAETRLKTPAQGNCFKEGCPGKHMRELCLLTAETPLV